MLKPFFEPDSVAVIGASSNPSKLGHAVLKNLVEGGFGKIGKVYPINLQGGEILGLNAYSSVGDVPDPIDLAERRQLRWINELERCFDFL